jgi:hypothetical protein
MLSYINPEYLLESESIDRLNDSYDQIQDQTLRYEVLNTLAQAGGKEGISLIIERSEQTTDYSEWKASMNALGNSHSETAYHYLHSLLDSLAPDKADHQQEMDVIKQSLEFFYQ